MAALLCILGSPTITHKYLDTTFVQSVMATKHVFGRLNRIVSSRSHPVDVLRGGDISSDDSNDNAHRPAQPVDVDRESITDSIPAETEVALSHHSNETSSETTAAKQTRDDAADQNSRATEGAHDGDSPTDEGDSTPIAGSESVGVMSPVKKSNAVGDPDGDDDDDDDDDDDEEEDLFVFDEEAEEVASSTATSTNNDTDDEDTLDPFSLDELDEDRAVERVQVEVEYTIEEEDEDDKHDDKDERIELHGAATTDSNTGASTRDNKRSRNLGGVGVRRFGQRFKNRNKRHNNDDNTLSDRDQKENSKLEQQYLEAWQSHIFFPPPPAPTNNNFWQYLHQHQQSIDTDGKLRLDRRTLYAGLLAEWTLSVHKTAVDSKRANRRKFLDTETSQALQAAVSLATQPIWRKSLQRPNAIRLYEINENDDKSTIGPTTLAMQETIALGLVCQCIFIIDSVESHSLTCSFSLVMSIWYFRRIVLVLEW